MSKVTETNEKSTMPDRVICDLCGKGKYQDCVDKAQIHSNVRQWKSHSFTVWRCPSCSSLHCLNDVDLNVYYRTYPFRQRKLDRFTRTVFKTYLHRLTHAGLSKNQMILDFGCSDGLLIDFLKEQGFANVYGYDAFVEKYSNRSVLTYKYDCIIAQDVIEHLEDPFATFDFLAAQIGTGGLFVIGTPRAEGVDLSRPERHIHSLHQPFHTHILSESILLEKARHSHFDIIQVMRRHITDTSTPFVNWAFLSRYLGSFDNTLDAGFDPPNFVKIFTSSTMLFMGLLGYYFPTASEMLLIFRKNS